MKLHRTKCAALIRKAVAPSLKEELREDFSGQKFSVLIDESTDISLQKLMCVVVVYVGKNGKVKFAYLGLIPVVAADAATLFAALEEELRSYGQTLENCVGFSSDGASVMVGNNNSVWTRIKEKSPQCVQLKCICHSLALSIQHAFCKLPSNVAFLIKEIPGWFSNSPLRRDNFCTLFNVMNSDSGLESGESHPTPFTKTSATRWLVRGKVLYNILTNWHELMAYFSVVEASTKGQPDVKFKARLLKEMLQDKANLLYLHFATPLVQEFERVNALFQSTHQDPHNLCQELDMLHRSLVGRLHDSNGVKKAMDDVDFGCKFLEQCEQHSAEAIDDAAGSTKISHIKQRCYEMLEEAIVQVKKRLPYSMDMFRNLSLLHPKKVLTQMDRPAFKDLPFQHFLNDQKSAAEEQYRRLIFVDWAKEKPFAETGLPNDSVAFWEGVRQHNGFQTIADYALTCLLVPTSNAVIERIFSIVTATKTKPRNKLGVTSLDSLVRIKAHLQLASKCCRDFVVTPAMIALHSSWNLYGAPLRSKPIATSLPPTCEPTHGEQEQEKEADEAVLQYLL
ncbi:hypothetical protein EGW08_000496 [Elysia chlorotica]|uniref:DUF4371 domain-containing protein n=1 Tax=Elysia chlorotica TaxID=188477 RepID=A0A433UDD2_ELYCH|nr:hypothetical protein EGW08_000496 [Elysia chlorotica]